MTRTGGHALLVGNSDGIGLVLTRRLLESGWTVTGISRRQSPVEHDRYRHVVADVAAPDYPALLAAAVEPVDRIDACVYAAGIGEPLDLADLATQTRAFEVNLVGAARTVEVVVPRMVAAGRGHLVGLSSLADVLVSGEAPAYSASKAGLTAYLKGLALALRPKGVRVSVVRFGFVDTKMGKAPSRPLLMSAQEAAEVVLRTLAGGRVTVSRPRRMAAVVGGLRAVTAARIRVLR
ncbi:SDR family NAD(P)-dependent oxidoreductase [Polymorphospora rubra]|uniref:SDR family NAD(P)-dependent oxidoreductase n=1 Tax=Polymorphospora rubra TaxID=338584 RepID=UPI0033E446A5